MQVARMRIDESGEWVRCGRCSNKLFKINKSDTSIKFTGIEIKCHSCKTINKFEEEREAES